MEFSFLGSAEANSGTRIRGQAVLFGKRFQDSPTGNVEVKEGKKGCAGRWLGSWSHRRTYELACPTSVQAGSIFHHLPVLAWWPLLGAWTLSDCQLTGQKGLTCSCREKTAPESCRPPVPALGAQGKATPPAVGNTPHWPVLMPLACFLWLHSKYVH